MKIKRGLALLLVLCLALSLAACSKNPAETTTTTTGGDGDTVVTDTNGDVVADPTDDGSTDDGSTVETDASGNTVTTEDGGTTGTTLPGQTTVASQQGGKVTTTARTTKTKVPVNTNVVTVATNVDKPFSEITFKEGTKKFDEGLNFGGETFTFATGSALTGHLLEYKEGFEKAYNAKIKVEPLGSEYFSKVAAKMATKEPYDILTTTALSYPENVLSNVFAPLEDHITTADLWTDESYKEGGFSKSLAQNLSWDGHMYIAGGPYLAGPIVVYYNKKLWKDAGYTGSQDPLALYKAGKWTWDVFYEQLSNIQDRDNGKYGVQDLIGYNGGLIPASYDTNVYKRTDDGRIVSNLNDSKLYSALETLKKFCYGNTAVINPEDKNENGRAQFLSGKTASLVSGAGWYVDLYEGAKTAAAFSKSTANLGVVPCPTPSASKVTPIWQFMGYGAGNGTDKQGILAALAYAKYDSVVNHNEAYCKEMPDEIQKLMRSIIDADNLVGTIYGFKSSAGSIGEVAGSIYTEVAKNGSQPAVVLKAYQKKLDKVIAAAISGS